MEVVWLILHRTQLVQVYLRNLIQLHNNTYYECINKSFSIKNAGPENFHNILGWLLQYCLNQITVDDHQKFATSKNHYNNSSFVVLVRSLIPTVAHTQWA